MRHTNHCFIVLVAAGLAGCSLTSDPVPYGKDAYIITSGDNWARYSPDELKAHAAKDAGAYCARQGKKLVVRDAHASANAQAATSGSVIFSCS
jgi:hypothetical protein